MALVVADRVKEISTTTGTGAYDLAGAAAGFQGFVAGVGDANTCLYAAFDGTDWEVGIGTVTDASPDTLARTTILASSNAGAAVDWAPGTKTLIVTLAADKALYREADGSVDMKTEKITNVVDPAAAQEAATKAYVDAAEPFAAGTRMLFQQTAAPTGWTKVTTGVNNKALRITTGTVGSGGATGFTSVFGAGKTAGNTTLIISQMPSHGHQPREYTSGAASRDRPTSQLRHTTPGNTTGPTTASTGGGSSHNHTLSLDLQFEDVIIATKD